jgi:hypothetical protein
LLAETTKEDMNGVGRGKHIITPFTRLFHEVETEKLTTMYQIARIYFKCHQRRYIDPKFWHPGLPPGLRRVELTTLPQTSNQLGEGLAPSPNSTPSALDFARPTFETR